MLFVCDDIRMRIYGLVFILNYGTSSRSRTAFIFQVMKYCVVRDFFIYSCLGDIKDFISATSIDFRYLSYFKKKYKDFGRDRIFCIYYVQN